MSRRIARKLASLSPREWGDMLAAQRALLAAQFRLWTRPTGQLFDAAAVVAATPVSDVPASAERAESIARAVTRAANYGLFRPYCLVRATALQQMLERRGIHGSRVRIGVKRENGSIAAHAWVEYGSLLLGDTSEHVATYSQLADVQMVPGVKGLRRT